MKVNFYQWYQVLHLRQDFVSLLFGLINFFLINFFPNTSGDEPYTRYDEGPYVSDLPNCIILGNWTFENFILTEEPVAKALQIFETCTLVNTNLWGKLVSKFDWPTIFDGNYFSSIFYSQF